MNDDSSWIEFPSDVPNFHLFDRVLYNSSQGVGFRQDNLDKLHNWPAYGPLIF